MTDTHLVPGNILVYLCIGHVWRIRTAEPVKVVPCQRVIQSHKYTPAFYLCVCVYVRLIGQNCEILKVTCAVPVPVCPVVHLKQGHCRKHGRRRCMHTSESVRCAQRGDVVIDGVKNIKFYVDRDPSPPYDKSVLPRASAASSSHIIVLYINGLDGCPCVQCGFPSSPGYHHPTPHSGCSMF